MKTLFLSTHDIGGGAARATHWLAQGLRERGENLSIFVQKKNGNDSWVKSLSGGYAKLFDLIKPSLDVLPLKTYRSNITGPWSLNLLPNTGLANRIKDFNPDILNIHWVGNGFFPISIMKKIQVPIVWSLYDMWPFTGGCHYDNSCERYAVGCGSCPQLGSHTYDLSSYVLRKKINSWAGLPITIVSPSNWLASEARKSKVFRDSRIEVIPHGTDLDIFKVIDKRYARNVLGLPQDINLVLFGAMGGTKDPRKGFQYLLPALERLSMMSMDQKVELVVFGASEPASGQDLSFPVHYLGRLHDDFSLALLYAAVDVAVTPSMQEAFGMTASEAMACGTPVVAYGASGPLDVVDHMNSGYLAQPYSIEDLANGIFWVLSNKERWRMLSVSARKKAEATFDLKLVSRKYSELYSELTGGVFDI